MGSCFGLVELPIYNRKTHRFVSPTGHLFGFDPPACRNEKGPNGAIQGSLPFTQSPPEKPRHVKLFFWGHLRSLMKVVGFWGPFASFGCQRDLHENSSNAPCPRMGHSALGAPDHPRPALRCGAAELSGEESSHGPGASEPHRDVGVPFPFFPDPSFHEIIKKPRETANY